MNLRSSSRNLVVVAALAQACVVAAPGATAKTPAAGHPAANVYIARAYALQGVTADGSRVERGIVAADIRILPLGTKIRLSGAGTYSGEYVVRDTGRLVQGRRLDVYVPTSSEARKFGRRLVQVEVLGSIKTAARSRKASVIPPSSPAPAAPTGQK